MIINGFRPLPEVRSISTSMIENMPFGKGVLTYGTLNTQTKTYDMRTLILVVCSFITLSSYAQFSIADGAPTEKPVFPTLEKYSDNLMTIFPTWKPGKKFLKENPSFLTDGTYKLNSSMIHRGEPNLMKEYPHYSPRYININSSMFPATFTQSEKKLDFAERVHFIFTMNDDAGIYLPLSKKWRLVDEVSSEIYGLDQLVRTYDERFSSSVNQLVSKKAISKYGVSPIPSSLYGEKEMSVNDLVLDFQCLGVWSYLKNDKEMLWAFVPPLGYLIPVLPNFWAFWVVKHKGSDYYPSLALYQLNVRDVTGNLITSYRQAIFIGEQHKYYKANALSLGIRTLLFQSMPVAMESLVNRFLNDEPAVALTRNYMQSLTQRMETNPNLLELAKAQAKINMYQRRKNSFRGYIEDNRINITNLGNVAQEIPQILSNQQQLNNAIYTDPTQQQLRGLGTNLGGAIGTMIVKSKIEKNAAEAAIVEGLFQTTVDNESRYVTAIGELIESDKDLAALVSKSKSINQFFVDEMKRVVQAKAESKQKTQATTETLKQAFSKNLTEFAARNNIPLAEMSAMNADGSTPEAKTTTGSAGASKTATDQCARQTQSALLNSAEYKKWQSTRNQADLKMMEWKHGMLLLQYCGDKLPPQDRDAIRKVAEQCRATANQLRSMTPNGIRN